MLRVPGPKLAARVRLLGSSNVTHTDSSPQKLAAWLDPSAPIDTCKRALSRVSEAAAVVECTTGLSDIQSLTHLHSCASQEY
jgi:hypothetical protein